MPINKTSPLWLHCCPWWLVSNQDVAEVTDAAYWLDKHALDAIYNTTNPIPVRLKNALRYYTAGQAEGSEEYYDQKNKEKS